MLRNIIFDWSGTLVSDLSAVWQTTNHVLQKAGIPALTQDEFRAKFCLPFRLFYDRLVPQVPLPELESWFHAEFPKWEHLIQVQPFAREFLQFCRQERLQILILSTIQAAHFRQQSERLGLAPFFDHCYVAVHDKRAQIRDILQRHQLRPTETLFVGDMQHDIETARHGGIWSCAVLTGYNLLPQLRQSAPDLIVANLSELQAILQANHLQWPQDHPPVRPKKDHPVPTVGALVFNDRGEMLLVRTPKWSELWGIPGGKINYGETALEALRRETKEETGLDLEDIRFVTVQDCIESTEFYRKEHFLLLNYVAQCKGKPVVHLNHEATAFQWANWEEAQKLALNGPTRRLIEHLMDTIVIREWEAYYHVGVPDSERVQPQKLLISLEMTTDFSPAASRDDLAHTIDYHAVVQSLQRLGQGRSWKLLETLAVEIADHILREFGPYSVTVEIQKFILPETKYVAVRLTRQRQSVR
jgi:FolB domain-containing protein